MRSSPSLYATGADMAGKKSVIDTTELTHPLSVELRRWQKFAEITTKQDMKDNIELSPKRKPESSPKAPIHTGGLVNFPKYMLIHNCHLKTQDQIRYVQEENAKREAAEQEARCRVQFGEEVGAAGDETQMSRLTQDTPSLKKTASWGQPLRFRTAEDRNNQWAGNPMPGGRCSRTSNPFRMG